MAILAIFLIWVLASIVLSPLLGGALHEQKRVGRPLSVPAAQRESSRQMAVRRAQFVLMRRAGARRVQFFDA